MLTASGVIAAFDEKTSGATSEGHLGGILQSSSYIAGVSGGSWLVSSLALYDYLPISKVVNHWKLKEPLLEGIPNFDVPKTPQINLNTLEQDSQSKDKTQIKVVPELNFKNGSLIDEILTYYRDLHLDVRLKKDLGFSLSFTDYWGRAIAKRIFPVFIRSPGVTLSDIVKLTSFKKHRQPFPILLANAQNPGAEMTNLDSQLFEFTPFEFGSWDPFLGAFVKIKYLGSALLNGSPTTTRDGKAICVVNFDNLGFITGTSSSLFNNVIIYVWQVAIHSSKETYNAIKSILVAFGLNLDKLDNTQDVVHSDYALYSPNPFNGVQSTEIYADNIVNSTALYLADGGEDGQNIPFQPLIQNFRKLDIIFSVDSTNDMNNWPNGTTINLTHERFYSKDSAYYQGTNWAKHRYYFPKVPTTQEIVENGLNTKPLFLGCELSAYEYLNINKLSPENLPPLVVYMANSQQSHLSNTSTFRLTYDDSDVHLMIENGYNIATYKNSSVDKTYSQCVGCAILKRDFDRSVLKDAGFEIPSFCRQCYDKYCWS